MGQNRSPLRTPKKRRVARGATGGFAQTLYCSIGGIARAFELRLVRLLNIIWRVSTRAIVADNVEASDWETA
ncbi:hypothetical protein FA13DRAFT_1736621 [Coprinellus micaceus]|uniref:Uncharacterized protein n=1 Tax=Coprinellus micaceus TaxID=71717 RepID=A0A4Y7SZE9_COPMI|nr:hypothetical protein FA13DRAFT_1736621 [Coprinellus micaceus]